MDREERLQKLLELATRGVGGEAENAKKIAEEFCKRYNLKMEVNEYRKVYLNNTTSAKMQLALLSANMCGVYCWRRGRAPVFFGKKEYVNLALDCLEYFKSLIPKDKRKNTSYIRGFTRGLWQAVSTSPGWVDCKKELDILGKAITEFKAIEQGREHKVSVDLREFSQGFDQGSSTNLNRQTNGVTRKAISKS